MMRPIAILSGSFSATHSGTAQVITANAGQCIRTTSLVGDHHPVDLLVVDACQ